LANTICHMSLVLASNVLCVADNSNSGFVIPLHMALDLLRPVWH